MQDNSYQAGQALPAGMQNSGMGHPMGSVPIGQEMSPSAHVMAGISGQSRDLQAGQMLPAVMQSSGIGQPYSSIPIGQVMSPSAHTIGGISGHSSARRTEAERRTEARYTFMMR